MRRPILAALRRLLPIIRFRLATLRHLPHMIRFRLTLWYTGLVAVVLAAFVGGVFITFDNYQTTSLDQHEAAKVIDTFHVQVAFIPHCNYNDNYPTGRTRRMFYGYCVRVTSPQVRNAAALTSSGEYIRYYTTDGKPIAAPNGAVPSAPPLNDKAVKKAVDDARQDKQATTLSTDSSGYHYVTVSLSDQGQRIIGIIAAPQTKVQQQTDELMHILIYAAVILLLTSAVGGWILAGRALQPIDELTRRARQITANDLSQRVNLDQEDELGRMAATFDDMIARLDEAFDRQRRFTSDASHELRTPLTVMQAEIGLALSRARSAEEYRQTLVSVDEEVVRLSAIVNDLLVLTRIDIDPVGMQHQAMALHELLSGLCKRVRLIATERNIAVIADDLEPATIYGDATRIRQLFTNLLDNAVTYSNQGGRVEVSLHRTRDGVRVSVSDTGIGIAEDQLPQIFERFYRTTEARQQNGHGTGLGLAISRSVAQAHHGEITVESTPGEGTVFTVFLPTDSRKPLRRVHGLRALVPGLVPAR